MDALVGFFVHYGYWGIFIGALVAGTVVPFSSEALVVVAVGPLGLDPWLTLWVALAGNVLGGMTCYWLGHLGNMEWIERWLHVKKEKLDSASAWVQSYGAWTALLAFIPIFGSALTVALGLLKANPWGTATFMAIGKCLRYVAVIWGTTALLG